MEVINLNNMNIDENTMKNIKNMVDNGNLSDAISNISPEMIQNFSKMQSLLFPQSFEYMQLESCLHRIPARQLETVLGRKTTRKVMM